MIEGVLTLQVGDDLIELQPGDFATVPPGVAHTFGNTDPDQPPVRAVNVMTPGGFDAYLREMMQLSGPPDEATMNEIGPRHGTSWVGPTIAARELIRRDHDRRQLRAALLEGARGPVTAADAAYFASLRDRARAAG